MTTDWTVLLIGGGPALGKTGAAKRIATVSGATLLAADDVRVALGIAAPPEPAPLEAFRDVAALVSTALERVVRHHLAVADKIVVEGVWITPALASTAAYPGARPGALRGVFVLEDPRERPTPIAPHESARARWLAVETKRHGVATVSARPVGRLAERILSVL